MDWLRDRFELGRRTDGASLLAMEGLRGLAVLLVFFVHFSDQMRALSGLSNIGTSLLEAVAQVGHAGVDLFFVLSGYLIYGSLIRRPVAFVPYAKRRLRRIYPVFLAVFALYLALLAVMPGQKELPADTPSLLVYLLQNLLFLPGLFSIPPLIIVAWSLSYEVFFYLAAPLVIGVLGLRAWPSAARVALFLAVALLLMAWCAAFTGPVRMVMFIAGMLLHEWLSGDRQASVSAVSVVLALVAAAAVSVLRADGAVGYTLRTAALCGAFVLLCAACFTGRSTLLGRLFAWTPLRWLGNMSYSFYLIHSLALNAFFRGVSRWGSSSGSDGLEVLALALASFAFSLLPAALLFLAVERPLSLGVPVPPRLAT